MDKKPIVVVQEGNPRGNNITPEEIEQVLKDIEYWFEQNAREVFDEVQTSKPAAEAEIKELTATLKISKLPPGLDLLIRRRNGGFQLTETYKTLSIKAILEAIETNSVQGYWNNGYIPIAVDIENNYLIIATEKEVEQKVISWNQDIGVLEEVSDNFGLYLEKLRNGLFGKKLEYVESLGIIEKV
eukprot:TRINITY_DN3229_c0_g4_i2.p1 TRINITY_DN3229_c0_g4~~TRINITY_DN3229_c0_g4_i2.p1  ORF type:complete len:185 (+),score=40.95 TRINITY_DN3229_c0_g4_i2:147-701(+)